MMGWMVACLLPLLCHQGCLPLSHHLKMSPTTPELTIVIDFFPLPLHSCMVVVRIIVLLLPTLLHGGLHSVLSCHVDCISGPPSTSYSLYVVAWHSVLYCHAVHVCVVPSEAFIHDFCVIHMHSVMDRYKGS